MGGPGHPLYSIAVQCLSDTPDQRPTSRDLVRRMEELCKKQLPLYSKNTLQILAEQAVLREALNEALTDLTNQSERFRKVCI